MMDIKMLEKRRQNLKILFELNDKGMVNINLLTFLIYFIRFCLYFISVSLFNGAGVDQCDLHFKLILSQYRKQLINNELVTLVGGRIFKTSFKRCFTF